MTDRALDAGVAIPAGLGRRQIGEALGTAPARWAASQVDRAVFAPGGFSEAEAGWLWDAARADRDEREASFGFWRRMRTAFALRSYGIRRERAADSDDRSHAKEMR